MVRSPPPSARKCPARGRRVKGGLLGRRQGDRLSPTLDAAPTPTGLSPVEGGWEQSRQNVKLLAKDLAWAGCFGSVQVSLAGWAPGGVAASQPDEFVGCGALPGTGTGGPTSPGLPLSLGDGVLEELVGRLEQLWVAGVVAAGGGGDVPAVYDDLIDRHRASDFRGHVVAPGPGSCRSRQSRLSKAPPAGPGAGDARPPVWPKPRPIGWCTKVLAGDSQVAPPILQTGHAGSISSPESHT